MKMAFYRVITFPVFLIIGTCNTAMIASAQTPEKSQSSPEALAVEKYQVQCQCISNETGTHAICHTPLHSLYGSSLSFFVYDNEKQEIIYEEARARSVNWVNNQKIKILPYVEMSSGQRVDFYYYHILTGIMKSDEPDL